MIPAQLPVPPEPDALMPVRFRQLQRWGRLGAEFAAGQLTLQGLNLLVGFALLRWLATEDYAQFSFAFGFQSMLAMLLDLGATGAITALVGQRTGDPAVIGGYIAAAKTLRLRLAWVVLPVGAICFFLAGARHGWPVLTTGLLLSSVILAVFAQSNASIHAVPLLMHRRLGTWYRAGALVAGGRLVGFGVLHGIGVLSGWLTAWANTAATAAMAWLCRRASAGLVVETAVATPAQRREMWRYLAPLIPGVAFAAFQGQITVFLITLFGRTENIAEVAALGRVGQVFALLGAFNGVVLQPHMAALPRERIFRRYLLVLTVAVLIGAIICIAGSMWPAPLLWLLGAHYQHLGPELGLLLLSAALSYVGSVMWVMHSARKWVFWWGSAAYIIGTLLVQLIVAATSDLSQTRAVILFSVWTAAAALAVHAATALYGFTRDTRDASP